MRSAVLPDVTGEDSLLQVIAPLRSAIAGHSLYRSIQSLESLQRFMESHVFAVWDFMSLLKALQQRLTCVGVPWLPVADAATSRLINEIVLGEESDTFDGGTISHFELYRVAMRSSGADTGAIDALIDRLRSRDTLQNALRSAPVEAAAFVHSTFALIEEDKLHKIAAAFAFGREDLIPDMFSAFVRELDSRMPGRIGPFRYYLERHIELDGDDHGPMAMLMMRNLCKTGQDWAEAAEAATAALAARLALWDGIEARLRT